jgi:hypothetical protein
VFKGSVGLVLWSVVVWSVVLWSVVLGEVDSSSLPRVRCWYASHHCSEVQGKTNLILYENLQVLIIYIAILRSLALSSLPMPMAATSLHDYENYVTRAHDKEHDPTLTKCEMKW